MQTVLGGYWKQPTRWLLSCPERKGCYAEARPLSGAFRRPYGHVGDGVLAPDRRGRLVGVSRRSGRADPQVQILLAGATSHQRRDWGARSLSADRCRLGN